MASFHEMIAYGKDLLHPCKGSAQGKCVLLNKLDLIRP